MAIPNSTSRCSKFPVQIERLEARNLFSALATAQADSVASMVSSPFSPQATVGAQPSGTLAVSVKIVSASVKESQAFSAKVTVTNTGSQTVSSVTPHLTQPTGSLVQAKYYSPAVASIAPGKSQVFAFSLMELVVGTDTLSADATSPFGTSSGAASVTMTVLPKTIGTSAVTNASGDAYLKVGPNTVPIQIVDQNTGLPITGLTVAIAGANRQNSRAVMVVADSEGRYPLQMVVLQGTAVAARAGLAKGQVRAAALAPASSAPTSVDIASGAGTALSAAVGAISSAFLPPVSVGDTPTGISGAFTAALKSLTASKLPLPLPFVGTGAPRMLYSSGPVHLSETEARLQQVVTEFAATGTVGEVIMGGLELVTAGNINLPLAAVMLTSDFTFAATSNLLLEDTNASDVNISVESSGGFPFILVTPVVPAGASQITFTPKSATADVTIIPKDSNGQPIPGGSYELISKDDLGMSIAGVLDSNGSANLPVELGNYDVHISAPGSQTYSNSSLNVPAGGTTLNPNLAAQPIVSGTLTSALGQATGFQAAGTQYYLTPTFYDKNGNVVQPIGPVIFQVHNPVGATVATVDPTTGLVTMGPGFGAALITAWCNGVTTTAKLVSTNGNGKYPVQPSTPFAVSPGTLHFTAIQGTNPPSQSFNVIGLADKFTGFHYTDKNGWLTVAPDNVSAYNVFNVSVDVSGLSPGNYSLPITISDDKSSYRQNVIVTLTVTAAPTPTLAGTYSGNWSYPVFGFGDDYAILTWHLNQSGHTVTGSYTSVIQDGSVDSTGTVNSDTFTGTIEGNSLVLNDTGGSSFFATITGNTITGTSNYLQVTSSYTLTAQ